jgi:DNA-binding ferritin-like protein
MIYDTTIVLFAKKMISQGYSPKSVMSEIVKHCKIPRYEARYITVQAYFKSIK